MSRAFAVSLVLLSASAGVAQVPPGYRVIQLTESPAWDYGARLNNLGQIVFSSQTDPNNRNTAEVFLYDANTRELTRLTNNSLADQWPDINDAGTIVWSRRIGPPDAYGLTSEIVRLEGGVLTRITDDALNDGGARINNLGHIVWYKWHGEGCDNDSANIYLYDGQSIVAITNDLWSNVSPEINDVRQIVWSQRDFCPANWASQIMM